MKARISILLLLAAFPSSVFALGFRLVDHGAEAMARAGAFVATADNPSALYYNQAGITQLDGFGVLVNTYGIGFESTVDSHVPGPDLDSKFGIDVLGDAFFTWKRKDQPVALGLGFYSPFGLGYEFPDDAAFRTIGKKGKIQMFTANPVIALQVTRQLSLAVGMSINYSRAKLTRGIVTPGDEFSVEGAGVGYGVTAGLLWQPAKQHSFGVQYFGPIDVTYSGHARTRIPGFTAQVPVAPGITIPFDVPRLENEEDADIKIQFPQTITAGYSFRPTDDWNFEVDVSWTDWDSLNSPTLHLSENLDAPVVFNFRSSFIYEFGVTRKFANGWSASAGYLYSENSVPNESFGPLIPDSDRHVFSIGVGRTYEHWNWYLGYQYAYGPHRNISRAPLLGEGSFGDRPRSLADGNYRFQAHAFSLSMGYSF